MKLFLIVILTVFITEEISCCNTQDCQTCCQTSTNCCQTNSDCCRTNKNCCQTNSDCCRTNKNCCQTNSDCCRTNKNCCNGNTGCDSSDCRTPETTTRPPSVPNQPSSSSTPDKIVENSEAISVNATNNPNITFSLNFNNNMTNVNHINNPISITNDNQQNLAVYFMASEIYNPPSNDVTSTTKPPVTPSTTPSTTPATIPSTTPCKPIPILVPVPQEVPNPVATVLGCCMVITPCVYGAEDCNPYRRVCGRQCSHPYMYQPMNPCGLGGCFKRPFSTWNHCEYAGCSPRVVDCSFCQDDFYVTYQGFNRCGGCFY